MRTRLAAALGIEFPIIQAPMAGSNGADLVIAVSNAGGLGSLPCAMLGPDDARRELGVIRAATDRPVNVNVVCHQSPKADATALERWRAQLALYYSELGVEPAPVAAGGAREPFDGAMCEVVEEFRPEVVSFHFGLPEYALLERVRTTGATILASATTVREARWLVDHGCDVVIAQGLEAGGHRGMFLTDDVATQVGTMALVPQVVDAVDVPVIAAGGIADARGIVAALALGAEAVQLGTAFLRCPEATTSAVHRRALAAADESATALTNVITGRPARGIVNRLMVEAGPMATGVPPFPLATPALAPLRAAAEQQGSGDFSPLWSGQAAALGEEIPAAELVARLASEVDTLIDQLRSYSDLQ